MTVNEIKEKVLNNKDITKEEAVFLIDADLEEVASAADEIRKKYNGNSFDMCAIMSVKGGRCSENCKFCAQSSCSSADIPEYKVRDRDYVVADAKKRNNPGISFFRSGSNATISGDMLTVKGVSPEKDLENIRKLGYEIAE